MKNFFRKIFGGPVKDDRRERSPRVRIPLADRAFFVASNGKSFPLRNISETGVALQGTEERFPDEVNGEIHLGNEKIYVELILVRRNGSDVAAAFADDPAPVRAFLRRIFADELHAQSMAEVSGELQKGKEEGTPRWFYAPENYELYYVEHEGAITRFELGWGATLMAFANGVLREGKVRGGERSHAQAMSELVDWQSAVSGESRAKALRLLENIPSLDGGARRQMQAALSGQSS